MFAINAANAKANVFEVSGSDPIEWFFTGKFRQLVAPDPKRRERPTVLLVSGMPGQRISAFRAAYTMAWRRPHVAVVDPVTRDVYWNTGPHWPHVLVVPYSFDAVDQRMLALRVAINFIAASPRISPEMDILIDRIPVGERHVSKMIAQYLGTRPVRNPYRDRDRGSDSDRGGLFGSFTVKGD
jgi:hypothetical protein